MLHIQSVSSLEKVFPDAPIDASAPAGQGFLNEVISWQIVLTADELHNVQAHTDCPCITLQQVRTVPVHLPVRRGFFYDLVKNICYFFENI